MATHEILQETRKIHEASDNHGAGRTSLLRKKKSRAKIDREILASVKKEMERPRLAASVRNALEAEAELAAETLARHSASE
jgi:hypothetical protein